jgi:hypothetical protein
MCPWRPAELEGIVFGRVRRMQRQSRAGQACKVLPGVTGLVG